MSAGSRRGLYFVALLVLLAGLFAPSGATGRPSEAAPATPPPQATIQRGAGRVGLSPTLLGDINNDGIVDIRDYGLWRQNFGQTNCGNPADADGNCLVDIRDYGVWRLHFGEGTPPDRRPAAALPAGTSPAPGGTPGPAAGTLSGASPTACWSAERNRPTLQHDGPDERLPRRPRRPRPPHPHYRAASTSPTKAVTRSR